MHNNYIGDTLPHARYRYSTICTEMSYRDAFAIPCNWCLDHGGELAVVWRAKRNKNQSATLRALPRNIATWTPQYYAIDVATSSASDPVILRGLRQRGVRRSRNIAGSSLRWKAHARVKSAKFTDDSRIILWLKLNYCSRTVAINTPCISGVWHSHRPPS